MKQISNNAVLKKRTNNKLAIDKFTFKLGFLLASVGSAVGLGNLWRFPYLAHTYGSGSFIIMYLVCVLLIGIPLVLAEFIIGKEASNKNNRNLGVFAIFTTHNNSLLVKAMAIMAIFTCWAILTYYFVVFGWVISYFFKSLFGFIAFTIPNTEYYGNIFNNLLNSKLEVLLATFLAIALNALIVIKGVSKGIERLTLIAIPLLFLILIVMVIRILTLDGALKGVAYYFNVSSSSFTGRGLLAALGQAFFSLSIGIGVLATYATYVKKNNNLLNTATNVSLLDSLVALLAGLIIIPLLIVFGFSGAGGPGLVFITLPAIFSQMFMGTSFAVLFFLLLAIAAITSTVSLLEVIVAATMNKFKTSRKTTTIVISSSIFLVSIFQILSFNTLSGFKIFGMDLFTLFDYVTGSILIPLGGLAICVIMGLILNKQIIKKLHTNYDNRTFLQKIKLYEGWFFWIKYVAPIIILVILIAGLIT